MNSQAKEYCNDLDQWVRGHEDWSFEGERYFGNKCPEIKENRDHIFANATVTSTGVVVTRLSFGEQHTASMTRKAARQKNWTSSARPSRLASHYYNHPSPADHEDGSKDVSRNEFREMKQRISTTSLSRGPRERSDARRTHVLQCTPKSDQRKRDAEYEARVSCTNSSPLQYVQRPHAVYQLV